MISRGGPQLNQIVKQSDELPAAEDVVKARTTTVSHLLNVEKLRTEKIGKTKYWKDFKKNGMKKKGPGTDEGSCATS